MSSPANLVAAQQLAANLRDQAELMRARARQLGAAEASMRWRSWAANAFRDRLVATIALLSHTAGQFDAAADEVLTLAMVS